MKQSRMGSLVETLVNIVIGFTFNFVLNLVILPVFFDKHISLSANFAMGCIFTVTSILRSYGIRRWFNGPLHDFISKRFPA